MPRSYACELAKFQEFLGTPIFIGLLLSPPSGTDAAPEVSDPVYSRQQIVLLPEGFLSAANAADITWSGCSETWPVVAYFQLYNLAGDPLYWGTLARSLTAIRGTFTIPAGTLKVDWVNNVNYADLGRPNPISAANPGDFTATFQVRWRMDAADNFVHDAVLHDSSRNLHPARTGGIKGTTTAATLTSGTLDDAPDDLHAPVTYLPNFAGVATFLRTNLVPAADIGIMKRLHMIDTTRGATAGLTVAGPRALAF